MRVRAQREAVAALAVEHGAHIVLADAKPLSHLEGVGRPRGA